MDPIAGGLASVLMAAAYLTSNMWMADGGSPRVATAVHILGWLAQFYGHAAHEGRAPALLDNLFQVRPCTSNLSFFGHARFVLCFSKVVELQSRSSGVDLSCVLCSYVWTSRRVNATATVSVSTY